MEGKNVIFVETPSHLLPPTSGSLSLKYKRFNLGANEMVAKRAITTSQTTTLCAIFIYMSIVGHPGSASTDYVAARGLLENILVTERLDKYSTITRRDL